MPLARFLAEASATAPALATPPVHLKTQCASLLSRQRGPGRHRHRPCPDASHAQPTGEPLVIPEGMLIPGTWGRVIPRTDFNTEPPTTERGHPIAPDHVGPPREHEP